MSFSEKTIQEAWDRSSGKCECKRDSCKHTGRCNKELLQKSQGSESEYGWEAHHISADSADGSDGLSNCEILCQECHKNTQSYGG